MPRPVPKWGLTKFYEKTSNVLTIYGIPNCDKCRAAQKWFKAHAADFRFHDFRTDGLDADLVNNWLADFGTEKLVNTRSKTWRDLPAATKESFDVENACEIILEHPTLLQRPLVVNGATTLIGYDEAAWSDIG
jgi:arsenate reductase